MADASRFYWNRWFQRESRAVDALEVGRRYEFVLDLSRYRYREKQSSTAEPVLVGAIAAAKAAGDAHLTLRIRSILLGGVLSRAGDARVEEEMQVPLARLEAPTDPAAGEREARTWNALQQGRLSIPAAAPILQAAQISIAVLAERSGCAQIALAVFDVTGIRPLDHVIETVPVRTPGQPVPDCTVEETDARSGAGLSKLLLFSGASGHPEQADASLAVFETTVPGAVGRKRSVAVFVDARRYKASLSENNSVDHGVYGWLLESSLSGFVSDPAHLLTLIKGGRKQGNYGTVAQIISDKLFSTPNEGAEAEQPRKALAALQRIARESKTPPVVLARIVSADDDLVMLPLSLLAARGPKPILAKPIVVVHPLSRQHYVSSQVCVDRWNFGIPTSLEGFGNVSVDANPAPWISQWIRSLTALREFLATPAGTPGARDASPRAEGLVLLAHHSKGNLWFEDSANPVVPENIRREFPSGTVALLSACSVGDPTGDNSAILRKLNAKGIDAMIVSPFPVHAGYGTELAKHFANTVRSARDRKETRTLAELFRVAAAQAAASANKLPTAQGGGADFSEMHLEFVIAGDQEMRLCEN